MFTHGCHGPQRVINEGDKYLLVVTLGQLSYLPDAALLPLPQGGEDRAAHQEVKCEEEVDCPHWSWVCTVDRFPVS